MRCRRLTSWHRSRCKAAYSRTGNVKAAAKAAGIALGSAYRILRDIHRSDVVPVYPARLQARAVGMYVSGMSCRRVAAALALEMDPAPSQQWVFERVRAAGKLRSRSEADRLMNQHRTGKDYAAIARLALRMVVVEKRSITESAKLLGVSRNMVSKAVGRAAPTPSEATHRRAWEGPHAKPRLERLERVRELRNEGGTQGSIAEDLGVSPSTVFMDLRRLGMTGSRERPMQRVRVAPSRQEEQEGEIDDRDDGEIEASKFDDLEEGGVPDHEQGEEGADPGIRIQEVATQDHAREGRRGSPEAA